MLRALRRRLPHRFGSPFPHNAPIGRTDAGLDYLTPFHGPIWAIAKSIVLRIDPVGGGSWSGLGAVWLGLDYPASINGHVYHEWYSAESGWFHPGLAVGDHVTRGQVIAWTRSGWQETGFVGGQSFNEQTPTIEGEDFKAFVLLMRKRGQ